MLRKVNMEIPRDRYRYGDKEVIDFIEMGLSKGWSGRKIEREAKKTGMNFTRGRVRRYKDRKETKKQEQKETYMHRGSDRDTVKAFADQEGFDIDDVSMSWVKGKVGDVGVSALVRNSNTGKDLFEVLDEWVEKQDFKKIKLPKVEEVEKAMMLTITDAHVGLDPDPDGNALFEFEYNGDIYREKMLDVLGTMKKEVDYHGVFDKLYLNDLGDNLDGWNAFTTRGGHQLDQNMDNVTAFETYVEGKLSLIRGILEGGFAKNVVVNDVVNDNHSGDFGEIANYTIAKIIEAIYGEDAIEFRRMKRFIEHYTYGEHTFLATHGKDKKYMKTGMPLRMNDRVINFIRQYIDHYGIDNKYIHLQKGDLHQLGYDACNVFDYRNYMAFSPASPRVQSNFGSGYAGYSVDIIPKQGSGISHQDYFIDYKKKGSATNVKDD